MIEIARILVIDDEVGVCEGVKRALSPAGHHVDMTTSGDQGLRMIKENGYDLLLLDVMMPGVSGIDLLASIHSYDPDIVCIIITGYATVELAVNAIKQGAYDFLTKPFSIDELTLAISQGVERRRLSREAKRVAAVEAEAHQLAEEKSRLEELEKSKRQFFRLVTHELQAPINSIQSYLNLIRDGYVSAEQLPEIIKKCLMRAAEQRNMLSDLLQLGRLEVLSSHHTVKPVRLDATLQEVLEELQPQADGRKITIKVQMVTVIPPISADPLQCKSIWLNLLDNAIKYTPENGSVTVTLDVQSGTIHGRVADTGIGIPEEEQSQLFTEFYRTKNARQLGVLGTGLGLVIVKRIVEGLGGRISVWSKVDQGSIFSFEIPVEKTSD
jgi:two-component system sensor histidine kinase/response regulator